jgi:hypothetical protein
MPGRARAAGLLMMMPAFYSAFVLLFQVDQTGQRSLSALASGWARYSFGFWQNGLTGQERAYFALSGAVLLLALVLGVLTMVRGALVICLLFLVIEALLAIPGLVWNINDQSGWRKLPNWFVHARAVPFHYAPGSAWLLFVAAVVGLILGVGARRAGAGRSEQQKLQGYQGYQPQLVQPAYHDAAALQPLAADQAPAYPTQPVYSSEQATPAPAIAAAGWYPDPYGQTAQRYWDGSGWTEHTQP